MPEIPPFPPSERWSQIPTLFFPYKPGRPTPKIGFHYHSCMPLDTGIQVFSNSKVCPPPHGCDASAIPYQASFQGR